MVSVEAAAFTPTADLFRDLSVAARIAWYLLIAWAAFVALHYLLSGRTWLWALPDMVPPIAFLVVPLVAAGIALYGSAGVDRLWAAVAVMALLAAGAPWNGITLATGADKNRASPAGEAPLVVFVWNTQFWDQGKDAVSFSRFLRSRNADVYLLQEYVYWDWEQRREVPAARIEELAAAMPEYLVFTEGELVTMVRRRFAPRLMPGLPRTALRVDISVADTTVALYNVHMPVPVNLGENPFKAQFYRVVRAGAEQRRQAFHAVEEVLRDAPPAVVIGGDFNSSPAMRAMRRLRTEYVDIMRSAGRPYLATWPAGPRRLWRLDWVFASTRFSVQKARLVDPEGHSDHEAQLCSLWLLPSPTTPVSRRASADDHPTGERASSAPSNRGSQQRATLGGRSDTSRRHSRMGLSPSHKGRAD